jgi:hypothetical protein
VCAEHALLAVDADLGQQDVAAVAQQLLVAQVDFGFQLSAFRMSAWMGSTQDARNDTGRLEPARSLRAVS